MMMNRRQALVAMMGALGLATAEVYGASNVLAGAAKALSGKPVLSKEQAALAAEIADTIIPTTDDSPGAKAAGIAEFFQEMVTHYYDAEDQQVFANGLKKIDARSVKAHGNSFAALTEEQRKDVLLALENDPDATYYRMIKQLTVWGYFSSEAGTKQALRFAPIPGRYDGDVTIEPGTKAWANVAGV